LTDASGQAYEFLLYLPYGEQMASQKAAGYSTPYKFTGKELDIESGLYYYGARYYDPSISLWHGTDRMMEKYPMLSPYLYTANNPVNRIDPDGNDWYQENEGGSYKWFEGNGNQVGYTRVKEGHEYDAFDGRRVVLSNENRNWNYKQTPYSFSESETMKNVKAFGEMKIVNGIKNTFFGTVGMVGSVLYMTETATIGAALGGSTAFTLSAAEVVIGLGQIGDAINPKEQNQIIHNYSTLTGLAAGKLNSPYANQIDAIGGLIPGALTGGNFDSLYDLWKINNKSDVNAVLQGVDAFEDMRAGVNSIKDIKNKKK
jgi:RHS repeat-associated protein